MKVIFFALQYIYDSLVFHLTGKHWLGCVHQHPEQRGGRERFVDRLGERVAGGCRPFCDPEGGRAGGN